LHKPLLGYEYRKASGRKIPEAFHLEEQIFTFRTLKDRRYIVQLETYKYDIFIIKFYLKKHGSWKWKYNIRTNDHEAIRVINTCLNICLDLLNKQPTASFGFLASRTYNPNTKKLEDEAVNARYRVYIGKLLNYFSPQNFLHEENPEKSSYLILNRRNRTPKLKEKIEEMFKDLYVTTEL